MQKTLIIATAVSITCLTAASQAGVVITTEKVSPGDNGWDNFSTISNLSNTDYADASQGNADYMNRNNDSG